MSSSQSRARLGASVRALFLRTDDPYAGADLPSTRNAVAVLLVLHGVLTSVFLAIAPPTVEIGRAGWIVGAVVTIASLAAAYWVRNARADVTFDRVLVLTYAGLAAPVALEVLSGRLVPYQLLFLPLACAGSLHPPRRSATFLVTLVAAALAPLLLGQVGGDVRDALAWTVLCVVVGFVLLAYVAFVRRQRLELHRGERAARDLAADATKRVRDLQWIADAALQDVSLEELLSELLRRVVEALDVDHGGILLCEEAIEDFTVAALRGVGEEEAPGSAERLRGEFPVRVAEERRPVALEEIEPYGELELRLRASGLRSLLAVPLFLGQRVLGVLYIALRTKQRFTEDEASFLRLVADRAALAVERTRVFEDKRQIAETLQRSLLPAALPEVPGISMSARYLPGGPGLEVGGDWYDVVDLRDGRIGLIIGDVVGTGVRSASLMGMLRTALRAYAVEGHPPAVVLERVHRLLEDQGDRAI